MALLEKVWRSPRTLTSQSIDLDRCPKLWFTLGPFGENHINLKRKKEKDKAGQTPEQERDLGKNLTYPSPTITLQDRATELIQQD